MELRLLIILSNLFYSVRDRTGGHHLGLMDENNASKPLI